MDTWGLDTHIQQALCVCVRLTGKRRAVDWLQCMDTGAVL